MHKQKLSHSYVQIVQLQRLCERKRCKVNKFSHLIDYSALMSTIGFLEITFFGEISNSLFYQFYSFKVVVLQAF